MKVELPPDFMYIGPICAQGDLIGSNIATFILRKVVVSFEGPT
jgi:hypothetical protein